MEEGSNCLQGHQTPLGSVQNYYETLVSYVFLMLMVLKEGSRCHHGPKSTTGNAQNYHEGLYSQIYYLFTRIYYLKSIT